MKSIISYFERTSSINKKNYNEDDENKKLASLCAKTGLSFNQASSDALWDLIHYCMSKVNDLLTVENKIIVENLIKKPSRIKVAQIVKTEALKKKLTILENNNANYGVLAFDAAEIAHENYFVGILFFTTSTDKSIVVCFENDVKTQEEIAETCAKTLVEVSKYVSITNFVVDGLLHQIQALCLEPTSSLSNYQQHLKDFPISLPFLLPDIPHIIQLTFRHAVEFSSLKLKIYITEIDGLAAMIRKKEAVDFIGSRCPTFPKTRFLYSVLLMMFFVKHNEKILSFYNSTCNLKEIEEVNSLFQIIFQLLIFLKPLFILTTYFEKENGCAELVCLF